MPRPSANFTVSTGAWKSQFATFSKGKHATQAPRATRTNARSRRRGERRAHDLEALEQAPALEEVALAVEVHAARLEVEGLKREDAEGEDIGRRAIVLSLENLGRGVPVSADLCEGELSVSSALLFGK